MQIANTEGELYSLSARSPQFMWIHDFSSLDRVFTITAGNNGRLFITVPTKALVLALDVSTGNVLWQQSIGPLSPSEHAPVIDSNGKVPTGVQILRKSLDFVVWTIKDHCKLVHKHYKVLILFLALSIAVRFSASSQGPCENFIDSQASILSCSSIKVSVICAFAGFISIGSLDGCLYSISPTGTVKKFPESPPLKSVIQVGPVLDCSGYAVYVSQTQMDKKISRAIREYTYISALRPTSAVFVLLVPATGSIYWSETYSGTKRFTSFLFYSLIDLTS